jgi:hypothetical protein
MSKKYAAVSLWGFSGYITVVPKDENPDAQPAKKKEDLPVETAEESRCASSASYPKKSARSLTT